MLLLAIDTSTSAITVALHDGSAVLSHESVLDPRGHAEHLAPAVDRVLTTAKVQPRQLTDVVTGLGPGPFTGLRVGIVTGRTLAHAVGARLHGVCSLDALAQGVPTGPTGPPALLVATDARRREVYWRTYHPSGDRAQWVATSEPAVARAHDLPEQVRELATVGRGPLLYPAHLTNPVPAAEAPGSVALLDVDARHLAALAVLRLAAGADLAHGEPLYLRRPDAQPLAAVPA